MFAFLKTFFTLKDFPFKGNLANHQPYFHYKIEEQQ